MQEKDISRLVRIRITRSHKGILKRIPARVLIDNRYNGFYPSTVKEFDTEAGELTLVINKSKALTFDASGTGTREFIIKEGYTDIGFVLKYTILLSALGWLLYTIFFAQSETYDPSFSFFATLFLFWIVSQFRKEYFYLEEV